MRRDPAPRTDRPTCYGLTYRSSREDCVECSYAPRCAKASARWRKYRSLEQLARDERDDLTRKPAPVSDPFEAYADLHETYFGARPSRRRTSARNKAAIDRAAAYCAEESIDLQDWIAAHMFALTERGNQVYARAGFQARSMLVPTPKAKDRFNRVVTLHGMRYNRTTHDAMTASTDQRMADKAVLDDEREIGSLIAADRIEGVTLSPADAAELTLASDTWFEYHRDDPRRLYVLRLEAACSVAHMYEPGLPSRITFTEQRFEWGHLADFLAGRHEPAHIVRERRRKRMNSRMRDQLARGSIGV